MKKLWQKISIRIDSRTLRERSMLFGMIAALIIFLVFFLFLNPTYARHTLLLGDLAAAQEKIAVVEAEIAQTMIASTRDPDAAERLQLAKVQAEAATLRNSLMAMERGMVPASRMSSLLGTILQAHRGLRLVSMRSLGPMAPPAAAAAVPGAPPVPPAPPQLLHRHGFELVVEGSYGDLVNYMLALENLEGQLLWGSSRLDADSYPKATLTLVVYTVNLDKKWIKL